MVHNNKIIVRKSPNTGTEFLTEHWNAMKTSMRRLGVQC